MMKKGRKLLLLVLATLVILGCTIASSSAPTPEPATQASEATAIPDTQTEEPEPVATQTSKPTATLTSNEVLRMQELENWVSGNEGIEALKIVIHSSLGQYPLTEMNAWSEKAEQIDLSEGRRLDCWKDFGDIQLAENFFRLQMMLQVIVIEDEGNNNWSWRWLPDGEVLPSNTLGICLAPYLEVPPTATITPES